MATHGPTIPTALMVTTEGRVEVYPAAEDWHQKVELLRYASQRRQLFCPDCGERLKYYAEVRTPHFRHLRDVHGCTDEHKYPERAHARRERWFRNSLVSSFRQAMPPGTRFYADPYLGSQVPYMQVELPSGGAFILHVITEKPQMELWDRRKEEFRQAGLPVLHIFGRGRVKRAVELAEVGYSPITIDDGLNADHKDAIRHLLVDYAHTARQNFYDVPTMNAKPGTLYFFEEGATPNDVGELTILRGLLPDPDDTVWHACALKVGMSGQGQDRLRFTLRHGFYVTDDLDVLIWIRDGWRKRRRSKREQAKPIPPSETRLHPLQARWEQKQAEKAAEQERIRAEEAAAEAERLAEEERKQREAEKTRLERQAALEALREKNSRELEKVRTTYGQLIPILITEGKQALQGRAVPVPHPEVFQQPADVWQAAIVGFAYRARLDFSDHQAADWLSWRGFSKAGARRSGLANMQAFWTELAKFGFCRTRRDRYGTLWVTPTPSKLAFTWPASTVSGAVKEPALCVLCAAGNEQVKLALTERWRFHDPANGLCLCFDHA